MIPKVIHYCWFGGEKPQEVLSYIEGWRKLCPDYEIKEWNEKTFDIYSSNYAKAAYKEKKWAFVADYVRFSVLYQYGGVYLDTDVELIKNLDDLLNQEGIAGYESIGVGTGLIGCEPYNDIIHNILEYYNKTSFYLENGELNLLTSPECFSNELLKIGFLRENKLQHLKGMTVYPAECFCPISPATFKCQITEQTYAIHHYAGSWLDDKTKLRLPIQKKLTKYIGSRPAIWVSVAYAELKTGGIKSLVHAIRNRRKNT